MFWCSWEAQTLVIWDDKSIFVFFQMAEQLIGKLLVSGVESFLGPFPMKNEWFIDMKKVLQLNWGQLQLRSRN